MLYRIKEDKFLISVKVKELYLLINKISINIPNREYILKDKLDSDCLMLLELIYIANFTKDIGKKNDNKVLILAKISMIDFYLELSYKNKYISEKQLNSISNRLLTITKMIYKWINDESKIK